MIWLDELEKIAPPPTERQRGTVPLTSDWKATEQVLGVGVPSDFKEFLARYGSDATIEDEYSYFSPASQHAALLLPRATERAVCAYDMMRDGHPQHFPIAKFPLPGSFFPIGVTGNGDYFGWIIGDGPPETWQTAWLGDEEGVADIYDMPIVQWLVEFVQGRIKGKAMWLPDTFPMQFIPPEV